MITLTKQLIELCRTERGGYTKATIKAFGMSWSEMTHGWSRRLLGKKITEEAWNKALTGKIILLHYGRRKKARAKIPACFELDLQ